MPQIRYFHRGRYFRPSKPLHFLPPLKLTTGATQHPFTTADDRACKNTTRGQARDRKRSRYRKMVMTLANYLTLGNVADMKFLCRDHVRPPQIVDEVTNARHLFALLENQRLLAENSLYFLQTLLYYIARPDLYQIVLEFRADRQEDFKERGVDIVDQYQVNSEDDVQRLELANELLTFRKDLKPRRRFNQVDVTEMRRKLEALSVKMQDNINTIQRQNAPNRAHADNGPPQDDTVGQDENLTQTEQYSNVDTISKYKSNAPKPILERVKSDRVSQHQVSQLRGSIADTDKRVQSSHKTCRQDANEDNKGTTSLDTETSHLTQECTDREYITEDGVEHSDGNFGYETPCPPQRERALDINGVNVYADVSSNPVEPCGVKAQKYSTLSNQVAGKIHKLRRLSKEQRNSYKRRFQKKKKTKTVRSTDDRVMTSRADAESSVDKDKLKLPDIYDKYARQTAAQHYS